MVQNPFFSNLFAYSDKITAEMYNYTFTERSSVHETFEYQSVAKTRYNLTEDIFLYLKPYLFKSYGLEG